MEKKIKKIDVGEENMDFQVGNFINAVEQLVCYFQDQSSCDPDDYYRALEFYASLNKE